MGWEVFHQDTLILTPIRSTELTSKREGNCNVMIIGSADYGSTWSSHISLIITQPARDLPTSSFHSKILHASTTSSLPPLWALLCIASSLLQPHLPRTDSAINEHQLFLEQKSYTSYISQTSSLCWSLAHEKRLLADQHLSKFGAGRARRASSHSMESYWRRSHE